jgi:hypothetical protein
VRAAAGTDAGATTAAATTAATAATTAVGDRSRCGEDRRHGPWHCSPPVTRLRLAICLGLAGCPSKPPIDPVTTPASPKMCETMADHLVQLLGAGDGDMATKLHQGFSSRCTGDKWSMDAQQCFTALDAIAHAGDCASKLTIDQRNGFEQAIDEATR